MELVPDSAFRAQRLDPQGAEKEKMPVKKKLTAVCVLMAAVCLFAATAFAETGDVAGVIQSTWQSAAQQIKTVVNTVVFPRTGPYPRDRVFRKSGNNVL